jgi:hypothetical protein
MLEDDLLDCLDGVIRPLGGLPDAGEVFRDPPLDIVRYYVRGVRLHWLPLVGRGQSAVAVVRQPADLAFTREDCRRFHDRVIRAANGRFPPWGRRGGLALGLSVIAITPEPVRPEDEALLTQVLASPPRGRAVPLGLFRLNLGQEALAFALAEGPGGLFPEPQAIADALCERFRRFLPPLALG